jgi:hypothetical protein
MDVSMTRYARRVAPAALAVALIVGWPAPARAVLVEGSFQGFVVQGFASPLSPSNVSGTLSYGTTAPTEMGQTPTMGFYLFTAPGSATLGVTYTDPATGGSLASYTVEAPTIRMQVRGGLDELGRPNETVFAVVAFASGLQLELRIHSTLPGPAVLPDGSLPTASFPVGFDAEFTAFDFRDPNGVVRIPPALILGDLTLAVVPEPRAPLAAFGAGLLLTLWLRRRPPQRKINQLAPKERS